MRKIITIFLLIAAVIVPFVAFDVLPVIGDPSSAPNTHVSNIYEINTIVTSRLEKYREPTEKWLKDHGVKYKQLIMLDLPSAEERRKQGCHDIRH